MNYVKSANVGFDTDNFIKVKFPRSFTRQQAFKEQVRQLSFVKNLTLSEGIFTDRHYILDEGPEFTIRQITADKDFLPTFGIVIIEGRDFLPGDAEKAFLFNEAVYKNYQNEDRQLLQFQGKPVIGRVRDFHTSSFHSGIEPVCIILSDNPGELLSIRLDEGDHSMQIEEINRIWKSSIPDEPLDYAFYDSYFDGMYGKEERLIKTVALFGLVSIFITCLGLFGQAYHNTLRRTKEIGIHKINGAGIPEVMVMLYREFSIWITVAFFAGIPVIYYSMHKWLSIFAYRTSLDWWIIALSGLITILIAFTTISWVSWRAAIRNPVEALRYE